MRTQPPVVPGGFGLPLGMTLAVVAVLIARALGATGQPVLSVIGVVLAVDVLALLSTAGATLVTAAFGWCVHTGFVLGGHGTLEFTAQSRHDALVLLLCAAGASLFATLIRARPAAKAA
ncbi:hypothetical protein [Crossiella sp. CA198]|uniref:hypothetical protein n=1 Tax=Crossiella sp. CA198 TaxID=3455607 RepID=UPI003F8D1EFB